MKALKQHYKSIIIGTFLLVLVGGLVTYMMKSDFSLEEAIVNLWENYVADWGYVILFCWSILEGELGLIFAGIASHTGHLNVWLAIFIAGLGRICGRSNLFLHRSLQQRLYPSTSLKAKAQTCPSTLAFAKIWLEYYLYPAVYVWYAHHYPHKHRAHTLLCVKICHYQSYQRVGVGGDHHFACLGLWR